MWFEKRAEANSNNATKPAMWFLRRMRGKLLRLIRGKRSLFCYFCIVLDIKQKEMSQSRLSCPFCRQSGFKGTRGLNQHHTKSPWCMQQLRKLLASKPESTVSQHLLQSAPVAQLQGRQFLKRLQMSVHDLTKCLLNLTWNQHHAHLKRRQIQI